MSKATAARKERMILLVITHLLLGIIGVLVGVLLMAGKKTVNRDIQEGADSDARLSDFYTARISKVGFVNVRILGPHSRILFLPSIKERQVRLTMRSPFIPAAP
jgi:hypothetical protein